MKLKSLQTGGGGGVGGGGVVHTDFSLVFHEAILGMYRM